jgi:hypothetical protein
MLKPRPTDAEFDELKRKRDESAARFVARMCEEMGWDPKKAHVHVFWHYGPCYCGCPDGPCQHIWDGPDVEFDDGHGVSVPCSRCGMLAFSHDMRVAP